MKEMNSTERSNRPIEQIKNLLEVLWTHEMALRKPSRESLRPKLETSTIFTGYEDTGKNLDAYYPMTKLTPFPYIFVTNIESKKILTIHIRQLYVHLP